MCEVNSYHIQPHLRWGVFQPIPNNRTPACTASFILAVSHCLSEPAWALCGFSRINHTNWDNITHLKETLGPFSWCSDIFRLSDKWIRFVSLVGVCGGLMNICCAAAAVIVTVTTGTAWKSTRLSWVFFCASVYLSEI